MGHSTGEGMSLFRAQLLEVAVLVSVACWCSECKNESYFSGESCICQVYCLIKPIHLSTHWMPIKLHRMAQVDGGLLVPNFLIQLSFPASAHSGAARWQEISPVRWKCSWNNLLKKEMLQPKESLKYNITILNVVHFIQMKMSKACMSPSHAKCLCGVQIRSV